MSFGMFTLNNKMVALANSARSKSDSPSEAEPPPLPAASPSKSLESKPYFFNSSIFSRLSTSFFSSILIWFKDSMSLTWSSFEALSCLVSTTCLASFSSLACRTNSPASGNSFHPQISTGVEGGACLTIFPASSFIERTLQYVPPATITSPFVSVPCVIKTVASAPIPFWVLDSMTQPSTGVFLSFEAFKSMISLNVMIDSSSLSMFNPVSPETLTVCTSPP
ncbi:hypothetical protein WICPIJ_006460 [Wickerhamomyces pijperi]|uniref:Uncharacterized protein n=1 Tax=Wickerhamomyces pijperi TaxID=599730 RepID=A0A9P8Q3Y7_WICPI|nr:hypothetical protein WICPIJ_006460 [Wickerhamomyces pijperi]